MPRTRELTIMSSGSPTVFLSHTRELETYPENRSYVRAAIDAAIRAGYRPSEMQYFTARDQKPSAYCRERVQESDVFVCLVGFRYGSRVIDNPSMSYTELECIAAADCKIPRLIFLLGDNARGNLQVFADLEYGSLQVAFRKRLCESGITVQYFRTPDELETRVFQALITLRIARKRNVHPKVDLDRLPIPNVDQLFGRAEELALLRTTLEGGKHVAACLVSFAGGGKSAIIDSFLRSIAPSYGFAEYVFGWRFHTPDSGTARGADVSLFLSSVLEFFEWEDAIPAHDDEKARALLRHLRSRRYLLIMDGLEAVQEEYGGDYRIFESSMRILLTDLARDGLQGGGFVLLSSRHPLGELHRFPASVLELPVRRLDRSSGIRLLRHIGTVGSDDETGEAVEEYRGHPLALVLLGRALVSDWRGDVLQRIQLGGVASASNNDAPHMILEYYRRNWTDQAPRVLLYLMSISDRGMREQELDALIVGSSFAVPLRELPTNLRNRAVHHLHTSGLVERVGSSYECHPLVRAYFAQVFQREAKIEFQQAHATLCNYYSRIPKVECPDTLREVEPLYRAIRHGCLAGLYAEALDIYWRRICRGRKFFSQKQLGAYAADLLAVSHFFPDGWDGPPATQLTDADRAWSLGVAAFLLTSLGRLRDSLRARKANIELVTRLQDLGLAASDRRNYVNTLVHLGRLGEALSVATESVVFVEQLSLDASTSRYSGNMDKRRLEAACLSRKARVLHLMGRVEESRETFTDAERRYGAPLDRANGFAYCQLLADTAESPQNWEDIRRRADNAYSVSSAEEWLDNRADDRLMRAIAMWHLGEAVEAEDEFQAAVELVRKSGRLEKVPTAFMFRALFNQERARYSGDKQYAARCQEDLGEAEEVARLGEMRLYECELKYVRLVVAMDGKLGVPPRRALIEVREEAKEMGYGCLTHKIDRLLRVGSQ